MPIANEVKKRFNPRLFLIRLGDNCNLNCAYCYVNRGQGEISTDTLDTLIELISKWIIKNVDQKVYIAFIGGEPLLFRNKIDYFIRNISKVLKKRLNKVSFKIQSNGTLISREIVSWIKENNIRIGISLDGPEDIHDHIRRDMKNEGSYNSVVEGIRLLKLSKIEPFVITVITRYSYNKIDRIVELLNHLGIHYFRMNPILPIKKEHQNLALTPNQFFQSIQQLVASLIKLNKKGFKIKESNLENLFVAFLGLTPRNICFRHPCGAGLDMLVFNYDGRIYPCDNLISNEFIIGNIGSTSGINELGSSEVIYKLISRVPPKECERCGLQYLCNGGCLARIWNEKKTINGKSSWYCEFYRRVAPYLFEILLEEPEFIRGMLKSK
ncbi:MAG: radical SAM protein [Candidatus Njordarchaeales archaeon]